MYACATCRLGPKTLSTISGLLEGVYEQSAWCPEHGMRRIDLNVLAEHDGRDETFNRSWVRIRISCAKCGKRLDEGICSGSSKRSGVSD